MNDYMNNLEMNIDIQIYQSDRQGPLTLRQRVNIEAADFLEMAAILGQFKALADKLAKK